MWCHSASPLRFLKHTTQPMDECATTSHQSTSDAVFFVSRKTFVSLTESFRTTSVSTMFPFTALTIASKAVMTDTFGRPFWTAAPKFLKVEPQLHQWLQGTWPIAAGYTYRF